MSNLAHAMALVCEPPIPGPTLRSRKLSFFNKPWLSETASRVIAHLIGGLIVWLLGIAIAYTLGLPIPPASSSEPSSRQEVTN